MITVSSAEQAAFQSSAPKNLILEFPIGRTLTNEDIYLESAQLDQCICDESNLTFGNIYASRFSVKIFDDGLSYTGLTVIPKISVTVDGTTYERTLGTFVVKSDKLTSDKLYRDLTCYDALVDVLPFDYSAWHNARPNTYTLQNYRDAFFSHIGITQETVTLVNDNVTLSRFNADTVSGATILSAILQLNGVFGYIGSDNVFHYVTPNTSYDFSISDGSYVQGSLDYEDEPMTEITGVRIKGYSDDYGEEEDASVADVSSGDDTGSVLELENNYLIQSSSATDRQTMCNNLFSVLEGFTYYTTSVQFPVYIGLELGDVCRIITSRKTITFPVLKRTLSGITNLLDTFEAKGEGELVSNANSVSSGVNATSMAINQMRISVSELLADKASVESLTASNGRINTLETNYTTVNNTLTAHTAVINSLDSTYATITSLNATNAAVSNLDASKASITALNAANANITTLTSNYANIETILSGNAGVGTLQSIHLTTNNAVVDEAVIKALVSQYITVDDLVAGNIDTSKFNIVSSDNTITIIDGTQTFYDENGNVRIQIGQDANDEFTFVLYDATGQGVLIDADGIKASAIADGLITNAKVASNANISATKLDVGSLFSVINDDSNNTISSNKIYLNDSSQTLTQMYTSFSTSLETMGGDIDDMAIDVQTAMDNADAAIRAVEGISSLDNVTAVLSNDSHVVHTDYDGTGGSYTYANTTVSAYKGDADISSQVTITYTESTGLTGTWNSTTRTYQVTGMTADDGYVDFVISYTPSGGTTVTVTKRFSIAKSPDGRAGSAYNLQLSVNVMQKSSTFAFTPASVVLSALVSVGTQSSAYNGKFKVEESTDGSTWVQKYVSASVEGGTTYAPTTTANYIRCTLMDSNNVYLDSQTITVIADTSEISDDLSTAESSILSLTSRVGTVESGIDGLRVDLSETQTQLEGVSDNTFFYQVISDYTDADLVTLYAKVYREKNDIHDQFPPSWFSWHKKTEDGIVTIGSGYQTTVRKSQVGYGGTVVGRFTIFEEGLLVLPDGNYIVTPDGNRLKAYYQ